VKPWKVCKQCGKSFTPKRRGQPYCSNSCGKVRDALKMKLFQMQQADRNRAGYPGEGINQMRDAESKLIAAKKRLEARMGGSAASTGLGGLVASPPAGGLAANPLPKSTIKSPLGDILGLGGQTIQGIANQTISYQQVAELLQQPGQTQLQAQLASEQAAFGQTFQGRIVEQEKQVRKPVVVEKKDPRARKIKLED